MGEARHLAKALRRAVWRPQPLLSAEAEGVRKVQCREMSAFETRPPGSLRLLGTRTFDGSSLLLARYGVER